jgi:hypothetical protein
VGALVSGVDLCGLQGTLIELLSPDFQPGVLSGTEWNWMKGSCIGRGE